MEKLVILLNGDVTITDRLKAQIADARVVAVDGGMRHAHTLGLKPERWIGDFDSSNDALQAKWSGVKKIKYPADKDDTDGALALNYGMETGANEIVLVGGLSEQMDHGISHITQMIRLAGQNVRCFATSGAQEAWPLVAGAFRWDFPIGAVVSLIGLSALEKLSLSGVQWPLNGRDVEFGSTLTLSNMVTGIVTGHLTKGIGIVIVKDVQ